MIPCGCGTCKVSYKYVGYSCVQHSRWQAAWVKFGDVVITHHCRSQMLFILDGVGVVAPLIAPHSDMRYVI